MRKTGKRLFPVAVLFSELITANRRPVATSILIIDNIGMLSRLYKYAHITYVGGGFNKSGIHNVLEAAVYNKPVITGPNHKKFMEAVQLIKSGGAFVIQNEREMIDCINKLLYNVSGNYEKAGSASGDYVRRNAGAAQKIIQFIQEKRLLTS